jgi:hypothetical protein
LKFLTLELLVMMLLLILVKETAPLDGWFLPSVSSVWCIEQTPTSPVIAVDISEKTSKITGLGFRSLVGRCRRFAAEETVIVIIFTAIGTEQTP